MPGKQLLIIFLIFINIPAIAQSKPDSLRAFIPEISYTGDVVSNLSGGIKTGTAYLGMVNIEFSLRLWKNGLLFMDGANTHGGQPSQYLTGDYQIASNIEAGNHTYLQELWLRHSWKKAEVTVGLQDLNANLVNTYYGSLFMNSSFGTLPTVSYNVPAPIFPLTTIGITSKWNFSEKAALLVALFDGAPTDFSDNPHNLKWQFSRDDGILFFTELHRETRLKGNPGKIKGGIYLHQHLFPPPGNEFGDRDSLDRNNNGLYAIMDQEIWRRPSGKRALAFFLQFGISPRSHNLNQYYIGSGLNLSGVAGRGGNDNLGIAVAHDGLRTVTGKETAIEITYSFPLFNYFMLQPDIQYIINPAGTGSELDNCIVASLRFNLNF